MNRFVRTNAFIWAAVVFVLAMSRGVCAQEVSGVQPTADDDRDRVLVLRDGGVLVGRITCDDDRYLLKRDGTEVQIAATNVMFVALSMDDAYQQRVLLLDPPSVEAHLKLAEWCLSNDLLSHAERELASARELESPSPKLALLERRLAVAQERREKKTTSHTAVETKLAAGQPTAAPSEISDLPDGAVERFTRRVQPILVNNCTTSGCHQPGGAEKFQLDRAILRGLANRRSTMQNLAAALELVDRKRPQLSPLLTVPRRKHGGMKEPIFGPRQEPALRHLVEWVGLVTKSASSPPNVEATAENPDFVAAEGAASNRWSSPVMRVEWRDDKPAEVDTATGDNGGDAANPRAERLRYGPQLKRWQPRDPFDPEIFNRQNASQTKAAAPSEQTPSTESQ